jgi:hypothetical protein
MKAKISINDNSRFDNKNNNNILNKINHPIIYDFKKKVIFIL